MSGTNGSERLVAQNLSGLALERLEKAIMEGELGPGERLSESGLARRFGISRGPLREAIGQLEGRKLVTRISNQGARVVSLSKDDLLDLLQVRESLCGDRLMCLSLAQLLIRHPVFDCGPATAQMSAHRGFGRIWIARAQGGYDTFVFFEGFGRTARTHRKAVAV